MARASGGWACLLALSLCVGGVGGPKSARAEPMSSITPIAPKARAARLIARGDRLRAAGDSVSASAFYRDAISAAPREPDAYLALGDTYSAAGELSKAVEVFQVGLRYAGEHVLLLLGLARAYERNGNLIGALESLRVHALTYPSEAALHGERGRVAESLGRFVEALGARRMELHTWAQHSSDEEAKLQMSARIRALELLVASSDRARSHQLCAFMTSPVRRALARCP